jgi:CRISPR-associated protein Cas1
LKVSARDEPDQLRPVHEVGQVVLHGFTQITTQALRLCAEHNIGVHWITTAGTHMGSWSAGAGSVQRRIRQYKALTDEAFCLALAKRLVEARARGQLSFLLRASRDIGRDAGRDIAELKDATLTMRKLFSPLQRAASMDSLRGYEGSIGGLHSSVIVPLMPIGVEHTNSTATALVSKFVIVPLMPIGVELLG